MSLEVRGSLDPHVGVLDYEALAYKFKIIKVGAYHHLLDGFGISRYSNTSLLAVWNEARNSLTSPRTSPESILLQGNLTTDGTLLIDDYMTMLIEGKLTKGANGDLIANSAGTSGNDKYAIIGVGATPVLECVKGTYSGNGVTLYVKNPPSYEERIGLFIKNFHVRGALGRGIRIEGLSGGYNQVLAEGVHSTYHGYEGFYLRLLVDSQFFGCYGGSYYESLYVTSCTSLDFFGCYFGAGGNNGYNAITLNAAGKCGIHGGSIDLGKQHNVLITGGSIGCRIIGVKISNASQQTANVYSGIKLDSVLRCIILGNYFYKSVGNAMKYCIEEVGTSDYNVALGNTLTGWGTAGSIKVGANSDFAHNPSVA